VRLQAVFLAVFFRYIILIEEDHLSDLKNDIVEPLLDTISNANFTLFDFKFINFRYEGGTKLESDDVLFQDFMIDHYPDIHTQLKNVVSLRLDLANKEHHLLKVVESGLSNAFSNVGVTSDRQSKNDKSIPTLCNAIINNDYDQSYIRVTDYGTSRFLYFYPVEDSRIPFSNAETNQIFSSADTDEESNIRQVDSVKSVLIQGIDEVINQKSKEMEDHDKSKNAFTNERKKLLDRLLEVKYSTKLKFEKKNLQKNCSLA
jgi:hypothetical protein